MIKFVRLRNATPYEEFLRDLHNDFAKEVQEEIDKEILTSLTDANTTTTTPVLKQDKTIDRRDG